MNVHKKPSKTNAIEEYEKLENVDVEERPIEIRTRNSNVMNRYPEMVDYAYIQLDINDSPIEKKKKKKKQKEEWV
ncbi:unnamed protein product [Caenorhabditis angaria]|uniref:Uncharacterized protein n=1 Tax=Caenorhabditis angaria TaxID=860376 RepID=A0A9P1IQT6_9PELO|nr:unnamed protein product [Caenorhabditis angaria]